MEFIVNVISTIFENETQEKFRDNGCRRVNINLLFCHLFFIT